MSIPDVTKPLARDALDPERPAVRWSVRILLRRVVRGTRARGERKGPA